MRSEFASSSEDQISVTSFYLNEDEKERQLQTQPKARGSESSQVETLKELHGISPSWVAMSLGP